MALIGCKCRAWDSAICQHERLLVKKVLFDAAADLEPGFQPMAAHGNFGAIQDGGGFHLGQVVIPEQAENFSIEDGQLFHRSVETGPLGKVVWTRFIR